LRSELEADVTEMMNRVHLGVNSRFSPKAILIFRKIARGWGGILESPPWGRNEPTGHSGPLGRPHQVRGRMPCDHGTHRLRVSGSSEHSTDAIQIAPARGRAVHPMAAACCRPGPTGRCRHRAHGTSAADCRRRFAHRSSQSGSTAADVLLRVVPAPVPTQCHCRSS